MRLRLASYGWAVLGVNILVILWGAYVRATGSGAGCGSHWPLCNGDVIPRSPVVETVIEFVHRITSGLALVMVVGLVAWARRLYERDHRVRVAALASLVFIVIEALIGAALVRFDLVGDNASFARAVMLALHLMNTFFLLAAITLTAWWAGGGQPISLRGQGRLGWLLPLCLAGVMLLGMSGAITALGDTLFPHTSLSAAHKDFAPDAHALARLRFVHPLLAACIGLMVLLVCAHVRKSRPDTTAGRFATVVMALVLLQGAAGGFTIALLAPVAMQVTHLFLADSVWIAMVLFAAATLGQPEAAPQAARAATAKVPTPRPQSAPLRAMRRRPPA